MTGTLPDVAGLAAWMRGVERELRNLATGNRLNKATVVTAAGESIDMQTIAAAPAAAVAAQGTAEDAAAAAAGAQGTADTAVTAAVTAQTTAEDAIAAAAGAQGTADDAVAAASGAQSAADAANTAALQAAGIANGKGRVYYQPTAPAGDPNGLWIDSDDNKPYTWNATTSTWVASSDAGIQAAATAAGNAQTTATNAATAAGNAQTTADAAVTATAINRNPNFSAWAGVSPDSWATFTTAPTKETTLARSKPNAVRFTCTDATTQRGITATGATGSALVDLPIGLQYVTVEVDVQLVSGSSLGGAGLLLDWTGMTGTIRTVLALATEVPAPVVGKWYRVTKVLARPTTAAGTQTGWTTWLMGQFATGLGTQVVKDVLFDRLVLRPATAEEITAITAKATADTALTTANGKTKVYTAAAAPTGGSYTSGDIWRDTANGYRLSVWDPAANSGAGGWVLQAFGTGAFSAGAVTATVLSGDAIDGKTITGATFQTSAPGSGVPRVVIDAANGVRGMNAAGTVLTSLSASTGALTATGATIAGTIRTAPSGSRIEAAASAGATGSSGWLRFYSGITADAPGGITRDAFYIDQGGGNFTLQGHRLIIDSGTSNSAGPRILLELTDAYGGFGSVPRVITLEADHAYLPADTIIGARAADTGWANLTLAAGWTVGAEGARYKRINGVVYFQIHATRASWAAGVKLLDFPAGFRTAYPARFPSYGGGVTAGEVAAFAAGDCYVQYAGTGAVFVSGQFAVA